MLELISLHVPKCAGTSLRFCLQHIYGEGFYADYGNDRLLWPDSPFNKDAHYLENMAAGAAPIIQRLRAVHGHFHIRKYDGAKKAIRVTLLRDPVERAISHYFYWLWRHEKGDVLEGPLFRQLIGHQLSLTEFVRLPQIRNYYTGYFFRDVDMRCFDLIGDYADMGGWSRALGQELGMDIALPKINDDTSLHLAQRRAEVLSNGSVMAQLRDVLREETLFYERSVR